MKINFFKTAALFTAFSFPLASGCSDQEDKSKNDVQIVKPNDNVQVIKTKEVLDKERKELTQQEVKLANALLNRNQYLGSTLFNIAMSMPFSEEQTNIYDRYRMIITQQSNFNEKLHFTPKEKIPNEDLIELFEIAVKAADKGAPFVEPYLKLTTEELTTLIDKGFRNFSSTNFEEERHKKHVKDAVHVFDKYKEVSKEIGLQKPKLIQAIEKFNEDAKIANQAPYKERWISLKLLESLKSIK